MQLSQSAVAQRDPSKQKKSVTEKTGNKNGFFKFYSGGLLCYSAA
jgi:hypothetical protein